MRKLRMRLSVAVVGLLVLAVWVAGVEAQDPSVVLADGGIQFPDGTVQNSALIGFAPVEDTGQQECWDSAGDPIGCGGTGQDGELLAGVDWPAPRFTDNNDGTVTDNLTGLIWLQNANCFMGPTWEEALGNAALLGNFQCGLTDGSQAGDWRLPNIKELLSLVDYGESSPALPGHPFTSVQSSEYWSSSSFASFLSFAWTVSMDFGFGNTDSKPSSNSNFVWPVRGGQ